MLANIATVKFKSDISRLKEKSLFLKIPKSSKGFSFRRSVKIKLTKSIKPRATPRSKSGLFHPKVWPKFKAMNKRTITAVICKPPDKSTSFIEPCPSSSGKARLPKIQANIPIGTLIQKI